MDAALHQQPRVGGTHLALVEEDAEGGLLCGQVQVLAVVEHQVRALAPAFEPDLLEVGLRRILHEELAHLGGAGEHQAIHIRVQAQGPSGFAAQARHHVEHAFRQTGLQGQFGQAQRRERRLLGGLEHYRVAHRQGRRQLPGGHVQGEVPGHHRADHPQGHAADAGVAVAGAGGHLIVELVDAFGVPGEDIGRAGHVDVPGVHHRLAHVQAVQQGQFLAVGQHQFGQAQQDLLALHRGHARPGPALEGPARGATARSTSLRHRR